MTLGSHRLEFNFIRLYQRVSQTVLDDYRQSVEGYAVQALKATPRYREVTRRYAKLVP
jgi:hypothetical protein